MGWANCDRFYKSGQPLLAPMKIEIKPTNNIYIYIIFKEVKSIVTLNPISDRFEVRGVPSNAKVQILGLKRNGVNMELFLEEGALKKLNEA